MRLRSQNSKRIQKKMVCVRQSRTHSICEFLLILGKMLNRKCNVPVDLIYQHVLFWVISLWEPAPNPSSGSISGPAR